MDFLTLILVFLHILGAAAIFGGWLANFKTPTVNVWQWYGAIAQLITGLALVGMAEAGDGDVNHMKIGVKVVIAIAILVAAFIGRKKVKAGEEVSTGIAHATGGLALINIAIATLWV
ncbi:hypothetical protein CQ010_02970 [Arthrobacter sp. MYb211]|uniref:hypothetical protein n=1 Tax=Micrococcaceae TaxID=1268 RepID=UPI000BB6FA4A|nr:MULTISPECIES: hypothetical protein [Micrococcaceae]PCC28548.1 hypothetical protein CIK76_11175 [Glutamicibacter sp. BW80]PRA01454.1 hypothetical protein CQ017_02910 [Arthrobacter sp. MYb224]PRA06354.1 hypothetical protein CQ019_02870 [Arthrobacter sp. MYb229]PRA12709.1 hypothetical protein CQ015_05560 [Arthrobacter sp. MYb221]PRB53256.1 hypothetical protein CQ013_02870 [Arthrobacter sp. MYb216]